jgi:prolyl-tRNA synthetase
MRLSKMVGRRIKETPREATTASHIFLMRGGYIRPVSAGIYSLLPLGKRIVAKIEGIIREEMDRIEGQEVLMPVVLPAELWEESGRYAGVGPELLRFKDRNDKQMLLGMTHEEAVVHLCRTEVNSYKQLPAMLYQIQTKYRDEARPRAGLIRVREFTMKDAYSFHTSQADLEAYYERCHEAYERIFRRVGMREVVSIRSDAGMMGGKVAHEFMAVADCGEDTIFLSPDRQYKANREVATTGLTYTPGEAKPLEKVHTPGKTSIEDVAAFVGVTPSQTGKAVFYADADGGLVFAMIRGDIEVNETKLKNHVQATDLQFANDAQIRAVGSVPGYASPMGVDAKKVRIVCDPSARHSSNLVVGANEPDYHYLNFNFERDLGELAASVEVVDIASARAGDPCPITGEPLEEKRGIEVGNIFQLGTRYSEAMKCQYLDENGSSQTMIMGCYGIGVGRAMAAVAEQAHDDFGPIWPLSIAPYEVHICAIQYSKPEVQAAADALYLELQAAGIEVLFDDRNEKPGFMFADADLIGVPYRAIVSPRNLQEGVIEFKTRDGAQEAKLPLESAAVVLADRVADERARLAE